MKLPPLLSLCIVLITGIAIGGSISSLDCIQPYNTSVSAVSGLSVLVALVFATIMRHYERVATILVFIAVFALGVFLIKTEHHKYSLPFERNIEEYMMEKRAALTDILHTQGIEGDEYAVVSAMTLGERNNISKDLREKYSISGAAHVFALSGMHLGIIYMLLTLLFPQRLLFLYGRWRLTIAWITALIQIMTLWAYVMLVGSHPSIIRAAVMLTIYTVTRQMSRKPDGMSVLVFTLALLLILWPDWLFDVGFQMSFMAVGCIIALYPPLNNILTEVLPHRWYNVVPRLLIQTMLLSTCAQIGVAPLIALYFHRFSTYFLLTNLPISLLVSCIIYIAVLLFICGSFLITGITALAAQLLSFLTRILNSYVSWITSLPHASIDDIYITKAQTLIIYVMTACACLMVYHLIHGLRRRLNEVG